MKKSIMVILMLIVTSVIIYYCVRYLNNYNAASLYNESVVVIRDTITDTVFIIKTSYVPKIVYRDTGGHISHLLPIDTSAIIDDYFTKKVITDTIINDSRAQIIITDTLQKNMIISRSPVINLYNKSIETRVLPRVTNRSVFYAGIMTCGNRNQFGVGISAHYVSNGKSNLGLSYDFVNKQIFVSYSWYLF